MYGKPYGVLPYSVFDEQSSNAVYTLSITQGTYTLTGENQTLNANRFVSISQGTYTLTGKTISFGVKLSVLIVNGLYSLVGKTQTLTQSGGLVVGGKQRTQWQKDYERVVKNQNHDVKKSAQILSRVGGLARAAALTAKQRTNIATIAAKARWK